MPVLLTLCDCSLQQLWQQVSRGPNQFWTSISQRRFVELQIVFDPVEAGALGQTERRPVIRIDQQPGHLTPVRSGSIQAGFGQCSAYSQAACIRINAQGLMP